MKYALVALSLFFTTAAQAECISIQNGDEIKTGYLSSEAAYDVECDGQTEERNLTRDEAEMRADKLQMQADYDASPEGQARIAKINAEIEKERQKALVHPPISY